MSSNHWPGSYPQRPDPQQVPAQPYGQVPYGQAYGSQTYSQPGNQPYGPYGMPPHPPRRGTHPALVALAAVLVIAVGFCAYFLFFNKDSQTATPASSTPSATTEATPTKTPEEEPSKTRPETPRPKPKRTEELDQQVPRSSKPRASSPGKTPEMPQRFGDYILKEDEGAIRSYESDKSIFVVYFQPDRTMSDIGKDRLMEHPQSVGDAVCGAPKDKDPDSKVTVLCTAAAHGGVVTTSVGSMDNVSKELVAATTAEFISAWR